MRNHSWLPVLALCVAVAGCGGSGNGKAPARALYVGGAVPGVSQMAVYRIQPGAGIPDVMIGSEAGFFVTANTGGSYRLVWTGDVHNSAVYRHFYGSVWTQGHFTSQVIGCNGGFCPLEADDAITLAQNTSGGQRIDFDTFAADGLDGFDFVIDTEPVIFNLFIDGAQYPDRVYFPSTDRGGQIATSASFPFGLVTQ